MELRSIVFAERENGTIAELFLDGEHYGYIPEDPLRKVKIKGITGIPCGKYDVKLTYSPKYSAKFDGQKIPEIIVPNYIGIRIHPGNTVADTEGCQMVNAYWVSSPDKTSWVGGTSTGLSYNLNLLIMDAINSGESVTFEKVRDLNHIPTHREGQKI